MALTEGTIAAIIGAGASAAAAGAQTAIGASANRRAFKWGKKMFEYQADYSLPSAQMSRFAEAGLNPNLMYGQGSPGNVDFTMPRDQTDVSGLQRFSPEMLSAMQIGANIEKTNAETQLIKDKTETQQWINNFNSSTEQVKKDLLYGKLAEIVADYQGKSAHNFFEYGIEDKGNYYFHYDSGEKYSYTPKFTKGNGFFPAAAWKTLNLESQNNLLDARVSLVKMQTVFTEANKDLATIKKEIEKIYLENEQVLQDFRQVSPWFDSFCKALGIVGRVLK